MPRTNTSTRPADQEAAAGFEVRAPPRFSSGRQAPPSKYQCCKLSSAARAKRSARVVPAAAAAGVAEAAGTVAGLRRGLGLGVGELPDPGVGCVLGPEATSAAPWAGSSRARMAAVAAATPRRRTPVRAKPIGLDSGAPRR